MVELHTNLIATNCSVTADLTYSSINEAIEISLNIPVDAKMSVKEYIKENFQSIIDNIDNLLDLDIPGPISDIWPTVVDT